MDTFAAPIMMSLDWYFKLHGAGLKGWRPTVWNTALRAANEVVLAILKEQPEWSSKSRGDVKLTGVQQAQIARYACSCQATIHQYNEEYASEIWESSVSTWKSKTLSIYVTEVCTISIEISVIQARITNP